MIDEVLSRKVWESKRKELGSPSNPKHMDGEERLWEVVGVRLEKHLPDLLQSRADRENFARKRLGQNSKFHGWVRVEEKKGANPWMCGESLQEPADHMSRADTEGALPGATMGDLNGP